MQGPSAHKLLGTEISPERPQRNQDGLETKERAQRKVKAFSFFPLFCNLWAGLWKLGGRGTRSLRCYCVSDN